MYLEMCSVKVGRKALSLCREIGGCLFVQPLQALQVSAAHKVIGCQFPRMCPEMYLQMSSVKVGRKVLSLCREIGGASVCAASAGVVSFSCPKGYKIAVSEDVSGNVPGDVFCRGRKALSLRRELGGSVCVYIGS